MPDSLPATRLPVADARPAPARRPRIGVLALQGDVREHVDALGAVGADAVRVRTAPELAGVQGMVLPGGESTTIGRLLDVFSLLEPLQQAVAAGMPVYGSCAGMILLAAEVLDGRPDQRLVGGLDAVVRRNAFGRQVDSFERDLEVEGIAGGPVHAVFIRAPWVERAGPRVEVLAEVDGHPVAVRQGPLLATAFHPELGDDVGSGRGAADGRIHEMFVRLVREAAA